MRNKNKFIPKQNKNPTEQLKKTGDSKCMYIWVSKFHYTSKHECVTSSRRYHQYCSHLPRIWSWRRTEGIWHISCRPVLCSSCLPFRFSLSPFRPKFLLKCAGLSRRCRSVILFKQNPLTDRQHQRCSRVHFARERARTRIITAHWSSRTWGAKAMLLSRAISSDLNVYYLIDR